MWLLDMRTVKNLSVIWAALSIASLITYGFHLGSFVQPLQVVLDYYEAAMRVLFGGAEPYLTSALTHALRWTGWSLHLYPHWKHIFVLMWLYFAASGWADWGLSRRLAAKAGPAATLRGWHPIRWWRSMLSRLPARMWVSVFSTAWGVVVAVASSVAAGMIMIAPYDAESNSFVTAVVVTGAVLYEVGHNALGTTFLRDKDERWWSAFRGHSRFTLQFAGGGIIVVIIVTQVNKVPFVKTLPSPGLAFLAFSVLALAVYRVWVGIQFANRTPIPGWRWREVFDISVSGPLGLRMLEAIAGAVIFFLTVAGLHLVEL